MLSKLKCRVTGHILLCSQTISLYEDETADVEHAHTCGRCGLHVEFPKEPLEIEMVTMLRGQLGITNDWSDTIKTGMFEPPNLVH